MAIRITCPSCRASSSVDERLRGKKIRCAKCEEVVVVPGGGETERDEEDRPRRDGTQAPPKAPARRAREDDEDETPARKPRRDPQDDDERPQRRPAARARASDDDEAPRSRARRDRDDDEERPGRKKKPAKEGMSRGMMIGIGGGAVGLLAVVGLLIFLVFRFGGKDNLDGNTVALRITGIPDEDSRKLILDKLPALMGNNYNSRHSSTADGLYVTLTPVADPKAFAARIDFGEVTGIEGRVIHVVAKKFDVPGPNADAVTRALYEMKSPSVFTRRAAAKRLGELVRTNRRPEIIKILETLIDDHDIFIRHDAMKALTPWVTKENLPALTRALAHQEYGTRTGAIEALCRIKEEGVAELIAARLPAPNELFVAGTALRSMGPIAQKATAKYLVHSDLQVCLEAIKVLREIGTRQSGPALQAVAKDKTGILWVSAEEAYKLVMRRE